jgi:two-component system, NarL family, nitrate/nitrite response regulator NarL
VETFLRMKATATADSLPNSSQKKRGEAGGLTSRPAAGSGQSPTRIVLADSDAVFRYRVLRLLESESDFRVVGKASDSREVVRLARQLKPDLVLLGLPLGGCAGLGFLGDLVSASPSVRIVLLTPRIEKSLAVEALRLGVQGVVEKGTSPRVLLESFRTVIGGKYWLARENLALIVEALREVAPRGNGKGAPKENGLTRRELALITRVVAGLSNKEIGREFSISERTVKHHLTNIYEKLGISSRVQLAVFALNHHLSAAV